MKSRIKLTNLLKTELASIQTFFGKFVGSQFCCVGLSESYHDFALSSFDSEIRKNLFAQIKESIASGDPTENFSGESFSRSTASSSRISSTEGLIQPIDEDMIRIIDLKKSAVMLSYISISRFFGNETNVKASFSIHNTSHVSQINWFVNGWNVILRSSIVFSSLFNFHRILCYLKQIYYLIIHEAKLFVQAERLSGRGSSTLRWACESLNSYRKYEREIRRGFSAKCKSLVIKVTECLNECAARLGVSLRQTEDQLTRDMLAGTAAFINCTAGVNGDNPTELTRSDVDDVVRALLGNNAYTILDNIEGDDKFGTAPVRDAYFALCHTDLTKDMDNVTGFIQKNQYPSPMNALRSEWGAIGNLRFLISSIGSQSLNASSLGANVYNIFCVGMEAKVLGLLKFLLIDLEVLRDHKGQAKAA